jgi:hypothetical protein
MLDALQHLSAVAALAPSGAERPHNVVRAARLLGYADARSQALGYTRQSNEQREYARVLAALGAVFPQDVLARHMADGAAMPAEHAIELATAL